MFAVLISSEKGKDDEGDEVLKRYPVLQKFQDVFSTEIPEFPLHREVYFSIELMPEAALTYKALYRMSAPKLVWDLGAVGS